MATLKKVVRFTMLKQAADRRLLKRTKAGRAERLTLATRTRHYRKTEGRIKAKTYHYGMH